MSTFLAAVFCSLFLALCFLIPALLIIWSQDYQPVLDEHDPAYPIAAVPVIPEYNDKQKSEPAKVG